jgi:hypothetical protein
MKFLAKFTDIYYMGMDQTTFNLIGHRFQCQTYANFDPSLAQNQWRGRGPALKLTVCGQRRPFRAMDLPFLNKSLADHFRAVLTKQGLSVSTTEQAEIGQPVLIHRVVPSHEYVYYALCDYKLSPARASKPIVVLNLDAHHDDWGNGPLHQSTWARFAIDERLADVIHLPSVRCRCVEDLPSPTSNHLRWGWKNPQFLARLDSYFAKLRSIHDNNFEVWVTIDYDFLSLSHYGVNVYHLLPAEVAEELNNLTDFIRQLDLPVTTVIPCSTPEFINLLEGKQKEEYITEVTRLIIEAF